MNTQDHSAADDKNSQSTAISTLDDILDHLVDRLASGEQVAIDPYLEQYPEHKEVIKGAFTSLQHLFRASQDPSPTTSLAGSLETIESLRLPLGDFQLLREVGRGGMGVVYEAQQLSLNRTVAVKILPYAALLEPRQLDRFQLEARAAARLHHPNIVSIHAVGCERGIHFYAMEFIRGAAISEIIEQLRGGEARESSAPRTAIRSEPARTDESTSKSVCSQANLDTHPLVQLATQRTNRPSQFAKSIAALGASLAEALQYAHEQGVTHRDIKPSNLLIDDRGNPWITDFGLAQVHGDPGLTASGDRLGTLRYMSPEQARGRKLLDHRTDIYSLGATLFELLTLRHAIEGSDSEEILKKLDESSTPRVRQIASHVSVDLDTIIAKAMAKLPEDRYDSAADLANDLRRFLQNKPILARAPSRLHSLRRWVERHKITAALGAITILLTLALATAGPLVAWNYRRVVLEEQAARRAANQSRAHLRQLLRDSLTTTARALADVPQIDEVRVSLIRDTLQQYSRMLQDSPDDIELKFDVAKAQIQLSYVVQFWQDATEETIENYRQAKTHLEQLLAKFPDSPDYAYELSGAESSLALAISDLEGLRRSAQISDRLSKRFPDEPKYRSALGFGQKLIADELIRRGHLDEAELAAKNAVIAMRCNYNLSPNTPDGRVQLAIALATLAEVHFAKNQLSAATADLHEAIDLPTELASVALGTLPAKITRAQIQRYYANSLASRGLIMEAQRQLRISVSDLELIVTNYPLQDWARGELIQAYSSFAELHSITDVETSLASLSRAIQLADGTKSKDGLQILSAECRYQRGKLLWKLDRREQAHEDFQAAIDLATGRELRSAHRLLGEILCMVPDLSLRDANHAVEYAKLAMHQQDGNSLRALGIAYYRAGEFQHAIRLLQAAQSQRHGGDAREAYFLALAHHQMGDNDRALACLVDAKQLDQQPNLASRLDLILLRNEVHDAFPGDSPLQ